MNQLEFSRTKANFLNRRYGIRLGRRYAIAAAGAILVGVLGCPNLNNNDSAVAQSLPVQRQESPTTEQPAGEVVSEKMVAANTKFGFKLFSEILKQDSGKNVFVSPYSVAIALAMTYNGASGVTKQAMAKTLEIQGISLQQINSANATLKAILENSDPKVQLTIANSLWAKQNYPFQQDFLQKNQNFYKAKVTNLDFSAPGAPTVINNWVQQSTGGKIDKIIEKINPDDVLFLINAIYFKGKWTTAFDKKETGEYPFYLPSGGQKQHPMMSQTGEYKYYETQKFQSVSLPYGKDERFSLYIFLPKQNSSLSALHKDLNVENWEKWMTQFKNREGFIRLPRFKIEYDIKLNNALKALGMEVAFNSQADFSGMVSNLSGMGKKLAISDVKHKTFVEVNEEGTEAAAVTSVGIVAVSLAINFEEPFEMIVDRPFFAAIRDNQTKTVLFMGSIVEPQ